MAERHGDGVWIPHCPPRLKHRRRTSPQTVIPSSFARGKKKKTQSVRGRGGWESYFEGSAGVKERQRFDSLSSGERKIKRALPRSEMCQHSGKGRTLILKTNVSTHTSLQNSHSKLAAVSQPARRHLCLSNCRFHSNRGALRLYPGSRRRRTCRCPTLGW